MDDTTKTNAILAWVFSPITSYLWKDDKDAFVRHHAIQSLYLGIFNLATFVILFILNIFTAISFSFIPPFAAILQCLLGLVWLVWNVSVIVPRIIGAIKALNGETWEIPYLGEFMRKYIKL